jgi:5'-nucleotidase / UDP-sugar diphosphatase
LKPQQLIKMLLIFLVIILAQFGCSKQREGQVTILHTNDMHSQYVPMPAFWVDKNPKPEIGGMIALDYLIRKNRDIYPNSLLLDAGDMLTGTPLSKIKVNGALGGGFAEMMNVLNYDAFTIGNHEFDGGQENIAHLLNTMQFDVLSANFFLNNKQVAKKSYNIYRVGNIRIGVIGLIMDYVHDVVPKKHTANVTITDPAETAQKIINEIDSKTDLIVLLVHQGEDYDRQLTTQLKNVDVIVGGHSHTRITKLEKHNGIIVVQAGSKTQYLGRLTLDVEGDSVKQFDAELLPAWVDDVSSPNPQMVDLVNKYQAEIDKEYDTILGTLLSDWTKSPGGESNLGDFITDAFRNVCQVDFALINNSGIRKTLDAGPIKKLNIVEIMPFTNYLLQFQCSGKDVLKLAHNNAKAFVEHNGNFVQISGLTYTYSVSSAGDIRILNAQINGTNIDPSATYSGVSVDYVLDGNAEKYMGFTPPNLRDTGILDSDAVIEYIKKNPQVDSKIEGRMKRNG